jgi:hypothetical protein
MKAVNLKLVTAVATTLTLALLCSTQHVLAESKCKPAKGNFIETFEPQSNSATGTITDGKSLDGTTVSIFNSLGLPTADPAELTFTSIFTLKTEQGELKGSRNYILDIVAGQGVSMVKLNPGASTGKFAGATGVLFLNLIKSTTVALGPYYEVVGGQVCLVEQTEDRD